MSSFAMFLLEGGVDVEVAVDFDRIASFLEEETSKYSCGEYIYKIQAGKGTLGQEWNLVINAFDPDMEGQPLYPIGRMEVHSTGIGGTHLRVPPRIEQNVLGEDAADWDGKLFGSFVSQLLNSLHARELIDLPGVLPTV
ncbi:MAG: hypothetical protein FI717_01360 [SAR202 cluster bacterium]|nr:hypothetical protein [Chloroflexota bacterium]MQF96244.1 hypothetical protein [SAR202 cluster bacterium]HAA95348.1 hypothetical protein [Dehalococcoidia bacterium]MBO20272.1 hypothetical protein [Chloroflexota bacterium]MQG32935.1 hypothetical protein [SAR202 cluster bacterium]|tara:strand:- start:1015 stop:1431 length:417 start_codon:yes stop_codon:yes gene_type:complete